MAMPLISSQPSLHSGSGAASIGGAALEGLKARLTTGEVVELDDDACTFFEMDAWQRRKNRELFLCLYPALGGVPEFDPKRATAWERMKRVELLAWRLGREEHARLQEKAYQMRARGIAEVFSGSKWWQMIPSPPWNRPADAGRYYLPLFHGNAGKPPAWMEDISAPAEQSIAAAQMQLALPLGAD